jgi:endonuclease/exonuclease/phosphatase (EEP) superfamily protein YafD
VPFRSGGGKADPTQQRKKLDDLLDAAGAETLPVVIAGDMNMPDRTSSYRAFTDAMHDAVRSGFAWPTSLKWFQAPLLLRIDHIWVSEEWCADDGGSFTLAGSDHRGVNASVGPCRAPR